MTSTTEREKLYDACRGAAEFPTCNLCGLLVTPGQLWDESHIGRPKSLGGVTVGIAHRRCNREHNARVVTPRVAKAKRNRQKHIGAHRSAQPMRGGRDSEIKIRMNAPPVFRDSGKPVLSRPWVKHL